MEEMRQDIQPRTQALMVYYAAVACGVRRAGSPRVLSRAPLGNEAVQKQTKLTEKSETSSPRNKQKSLKEQFELKASLLTTISYVQGWYLNSKAQCMQYICVCGVCMCVCMTLYSLDVARDVLEDRGWMYDAWIAYPADKS